MLLLQLVVIIVIRFNGMEFVHIDSEFVSRHNLSFPIALGNEAIKHAFKVSAYPSYYILDGDNRVKSRSMGVR